MGSSVNEFKAAGAGEQPARDGHASEKRTASGTTSGEWLVNVADDVVVPMTTPEIVEGVRNGKLSERSLVWRIGMHDWSRLLEVPQLRLATGASAAAPASARVAVQPPVSVQAESQRRRNTLPLGFPAVRDPASVRQPAGFGATSPVTTPISAPRLSPPPKPNAAKQSSAPPATRHEEPHALAVYDRPAASLTFSDSVRAEWQGTAGLVHQGAAPAPSLPLVRPDVPLRLSPVPAVPARLQMRPSRAPTTLAPTTAEAENVADSRAVSPWGDLSVVLASEMRAVKASSKRVALWAAIGSALVASVLTLWLERAPASVTQTSAPVALAQVTARPAAEPAPAPLLLVAEASAKVRAPLASNALVAKSAPVVARAPAKPRAARPKPAAPATPHVSATPASTEPNPYEDTVASEAEGAPAAAPATVTAAPSVDSTPAPARAVAPASAATSTLTTTTP